MRVLVTDAHLGLTVSAIRSLGRRGAAVVAASPSPRALGFRSKYVSETVLSPLPDDNDQFVEFVLGAVQQFELEAVLPIGQDSCAALSRHHGVVSDAVAVAVPGWESMTIAMSKRMTVELAQELGVPTPETYVDASSVRGFPAVAKRETGSGQVRYLNRPEDLAQLEGSTWLIQEYVPGEGRGFFGLYEHGEERATFMHRRIRELPATGGMSTAAASVDDQRLRDLGGRLLHALRWHGVAMVEFKLDARDGDYKLMEINPKFWGSLELAIAAGVDFPWLAVQLAVGSPPEPPHVRPDVRFQWVFRDLLHAAGRPRDLPAWLLDLADPRVVKDISFRDPKPQLAEACATARALFKQLKDPTQRNPHGVPGLAGTLGERVDVR